MAYFHSLYACVFLLAVTTSLIFPLTEGRQLKSTKKQELNKDFRNKDNHQVKVTGEKMTSPPPPTHQSVKSSNLEAGNVDDFRPTTPGNSPGVGHSFEEHNVNAKPETLGKKVSVNVESSLAGNTVDFRPTMPGHSPGVGHSFQTKKAEPNA